MNFGTLDIGIEQYYKKLKYHGLDLSPEYVFIGFYLNDLIEPQGYIGIKDLDIIERLFNSKVLSELKTFNYLERIYKQIKYSNKQDLKNRFRWVQQYNKKEYIDSRDDFIKLIAEADMDWGSAWIPEKWEKAIYYLKKIKELCDSKDAKLVVFCFPVEPQVSGKIQWERFEYPQKQLGKITKDLNIPYFDLLPYLKKYKSQILFSDHCHYKSGGSRIVAEILFRLIKENPEVFSDLQKN